MKRLATVALALALLSGCATPPKHQGVTSASAPPPAPAPAPSFLQRYSESRRLAAAVALLDKGDTPGAVKALEAICAGVSAAGVTDEALFRLALLTLKPSTERPASPQVSQLLRRLKKEYPASPWTAQAAPVLELIYSAEELRRQNRNLRSSNQALTRDMGELNKTINELNHNIEQLKHLDLELEKKTR